MNNFHPLIELKSSVKSVAADQIKRACQTYWGGGGPGPPGHSPCYGTEGLTVEHVEDCGNSKIIFCFKRVIEPKIISVIWILFHE